jgi:hypothetical protein
VTIRSSRTGKEWKRALEEVAAGRWAEGSIDFTTDWGASADEILLRAPGGQAILVDDVLLYEPPWREREF